MPTDHVAACPCPGFLGFSPFEYPGPCQHNFQSKEAAARNKTEDSKKRRCGSIQPLPRGKARGNGRSSQ